jgi:peptide/nickel transport system substrate-binding protein
LYAKPNEIVTEEAWHIPIVNDLAPIVMSSRVKGFSHALPEWYDFKTVWLEKR